MSKPTVEEIEAALAAYYPSVPALVALHHSFVFTHMEAALTAAFDVRERNAGPWLRPEAHRCASCNRIHVRNSPYCQSCANYLRAVPAAPQPERHYDCPACQGVCGLDCDCDCPGVEP